MKSQMWLDYLFRLIVSPPPDAGSLHLSLLLFRNKFIFQSLHKNAFRTAILYRAGGLCQEDPLPQCTDTCEIITLP